MGYFVLFYRSHLSLSPSVPKPPILEVWALGQQQQHHVDAC